MKPIISKIPFLRRRQFLGDFGDLFGHLYYNRPFSHYHLAVEYRFVGSL